MILDTVSDLSRLANNLVFRDIDEAVCSRAWRLRGVSLFWRYFVWLLGYDHCKASYQWHYVRRLNMNKEIYERPKPHVNVGTIGHVQPKAEDVKCD